MYSSWCYKALRTILGVFPAELWFGRAVAKSSMTIASTLQVFPGGFPSWDFGVDQRMQDPRLRPIPSLHLQASRHEEGKTTSVSKTEKSCLLGELVLYLLTQHEHTRVTLFFQPRAHRFRKISEGESVYTGYYAQRPFVRVAETRRT